MTNDTIGDVFRSNRSAIPRSADEIEPHAAVAILDLDNPKVRIVRDFAREPLFGLARLDPFRLVRPDEGSFDASLPFDRHRLRGRLVEGGTAVEAIDFDEDRSGFRSTPAAEHRALALRAAAAQIGRDPHVRPQAHFRQCAWLRAAVSSSLTSRGVMSVARGNPCARSKSRSA